MARGRKKETLTPEERLQAALVPESEQPYPVPGNWCWVRLDSTTLIIMGQSPSGADTTDDSRCTPLIGGAADMGDAYPKATRYTKVPTKVSTNQDLILCIRATLGKPVYSDKEYCLGRGVAAIRPCIGDRSFYKYFFNAFEQYLYDNATGTTFAQVSSQILQQMPLPLPPLPEQQRIVDRIESLFAKLDEAKQKAQDALDSFETRKAAILHKAFTGDLTAQWRREHGVGMESWKTHKLVECFEIVSGIQKTPARSPRDNPIPYLAVANVYRDKIDLSDIRYFEVTPEELEKLKLQDKDILIVEGNGSGNEIGRCAMWHNELPLCIHQNHIIRMRNKTADVLPEYVLSYLNSQAGKSVMQERAKTTAGLFNLSAGKVKTIPLSFASLDEQTEIVRILDNLLAKERQAKEAAEGVLEQIGLIKKAILARAFRGELGTNDPSDESEVLALLQCDS
ncbi:restriction endonuclease subunit S [Anaerotruncus colihominis]|uniref:Type I restriction modification DNA specificity domain-containing protein n=1 Tax=Anaerotruncus colihominis TaxID=169435 RepID=A0A845T0T9_9FIRM|nr:restriction endonuclease subunit S [Anaerotruncus colihominis]MCR2025317.1 restriction endonuclease subunit S [Anaerotruncus colihominis]NDO40390.1 hypothetical protein [Anaerotruncus colihominis]